MVDGGGPVTRLTVTSSRDGARVRVVAQGEVDLSTADTLRSDLTAAAEPGSADVVVDLAGISFLDSTGVGALVHAQQDAVAHGSRMRVVNPQPVVRRVLEITGVLSRLAGRAA